MTYTEMMKTYANKVKQYSLEQCLHAISDINETLDIVGDDMTDGYVIKLYCELDAVRDRKMTLS
jgi:hypothetical protein